MVNPLVNHSYEGLINMSKLNKPKINSPFRYLYIVYIYMYIKILYHRQGTFEPSIFDFVLYIQVILPI